MPIQVGYLNKSQYKASKAPNQLPFTGNEDEKKRKTKTVKKTYYVKQNNNLVPILGIILTVVGGFIFKKQIGEFLKPLGESMGLMKKAATTASDTLEHASSSVSHASSYSGSSSSIGSSYGGSSSSYSSRSERTVSNGGERRKPKPIKEKPVTPITGNDGGPQPRGTGRTEADPTPITTPGLETPAPAGSQSSRAVTANSNTRTTSQGSRAAQSTESRIPAGTGETTGRNGRSSRRSHANNSATSTPTPTPANVGSDASRSSNAEPEQGFWERHLGRFFHRSENVTTAEVVSSGAGHTESVDPSVTGRKKRREFAPPPSPTPAAKAATTTPLPADHTQLTGMVKLKIAELKDRPFFNEPVKVILNDLSTGNFRIADIDPNTITKKIIDSNNNTLGFVATRNSDSIRFLDFEGTRIYFNSDTTNSLESITQPHPNGLKDWKFTRKFNSDEKIYLGETMYCNNTVDQTDLRELSRSRTSYASEMDRRQTTHKKGDLYSHKEFLKANCDGVEIEYGKDEHGLPKITKAMIFVGGNGNEATPVQVEYLMSHIKLIDMNAPIETVHESKYEDFINVEELVKVVKKLPGTPLEPSEVEPLLELRKLKPFSELKETEKPFFRALDIANMDADVYIARTELGEGDILVNSLGEVIGKMDRKLTGGIKEVTIGDCTKVEYSNLEPNKVASIATLNTHKKPVIRVDADGNVLSFAKYQEEPYARLGETHYDPVSGKAKKHYQDKNGENYLWVHFDAEGKQVTAASEWRDEWWRGIEDRNSAIYQEALKVRPFRLDGQEPDIVIENAESVAEAMSKNSHQLNEPKNLFNLQEAQMQYAMVIDETEQRLLQAAKSGTIQQDPDAAETLKRLNDLHLYGANQPAVIINPATGNNINGKAIFIEGPRPNTKAVNQLTASTRKANLTLEAAAAEATAEKQRKILMSDGSEGITGNSNNIILPWETKKCRPNLLEPKIKFVPTEGQIGPVSQHLDDMANQAEVVQINVLGANSITLKPTMVTITNPGNSSTYIMTHPDSTSEELIYFQKNDEKIPHFYKKKYPNRKQENISFENGKPVTFDAYNEQGYGRLRASLEEVNGEIKIASGERYNPEEGWLELSQEEIDNTPLPLSTSKPFEYFKEDANTLEANAGDIEIAAGKGITSTAPDETAVIAHSGTTSADMSGTAGNTSKKLIDSSDRIELSEGDVQDMNHMSGYNGEIYTGEGWQVIKNNELNKAILNDPNDHIREFLRFHDDGSVLIIANNQGFDAEKICRNAQGQITEHLDDPTGTSGGWPRVSPERFGVDESFLAKYFNLNGAVEVPTINTNGAEAINSGYFTTGKTRYSYSSGKTPAFQEDATSALIDDLDNDFTGRQQANRRDFGYTLYPNKKYRRTEIIAGTEPQNFVETNTEAVGNITYQALDSEVLKYKNRPQLIKFIPDSYTEQTIENGNELIRKMNEPLPDERLKEILSRKRPMYIPLPKKAETPATKPFVLGSNKPQQRELLAEVNSRNPQVNIMNGRTPEINVSSLTQRQVSDTVPFVTIKEFNPENVQNLSIGGRTLSEQELNEFTQLNTYFNAVDKDFLLENGRQFMDERTIKVLSSNNQNIFIVNQGEDEFGLYLGKRELGKIEYWNNESKTPKSLEIFNNKIMFSEDGTAYQVPEHLEEHGASEEVVQINIPGPAPTGSEGGKNLFKRFWGNTIGRLLNGP